MSLYNQFTTTSRHFSHFSRYVHRDQKETCHGVCLSPCPFLAAERLLSPTSLPPGPCPCLLTLSQTSLLMPSPHFEASCCEPRNATTLMLFGQKRSMSCIVKRICWDENPETTAIEPFAAHSQVCALKHFYNVPHLQYRETASQVGPKTAGKTFMFA